MTLKSLFAATALLTLVPAASQAAIISADIKVVMDLPYCCGSSTEEFEVIGASIGPSAELTLADRTVDSSYTGGVGVDVHDTANMLTLFVTETFSTGLADFQRIRVELSNILTDDGLITGFGLVSDLLTQELGSTYSITTGFTANSLSILYDTGGALPSDAFNIVTEGTAQFSWKTAGAVPEPASMTLLGLGLAGLGLSRRRKS